MKDMKGRFDVAQSLAPAARTATANGSAVDLANYEAATIVLDPGTISDGTHTPTVEGSDNGSTGWATVPATDLVGTLAPLASNTVQRAGYIGIKRYLRVKVTVAGATTGGVYSATVVRGSARKEPLA